MTDSKAVRGPRERSGPTSAPAPPFYRQVVAELRKVVWPTQEQLVTYFIVVLVFVADHDDDRVAARPGAGQAGVRGLQRQQHQLASRQPAQPAAPKLRVMEQPVSEQYDEQDELSVEPTDDNAADEPPSPTRRGPSDEAGESPDERGRRPTVPTIEDDPADAEVTDRPRPRDARDPEDEDVADSEPTTRAPSSRTTRGSTPRRTDEPSAGAEVTDDTEDDEATRPTDRGRGRRGCRRRARRGRRGGARAPTRSRSSAASCGPSRVTGSSCTPTPAWRTG